jgi:large subunit ribosomal protein L4
MSLAAAQVGTVDLLAEVFKLEEINKHLIWEAVRHHLAKRRSGTACTKSKWEVSGSGRKLWKQKGTGRARVGSIRSALWKGGSTVHGPKPRSYDYAFPKQARRSALRNVLSAKYAAGQLLVVENWAVETHKTKALAATLGQLGVNGSALLVGTEASEKAVLAAGNNPKLATIESLGVNVYDLLKYDQVVFSKEAILALQEVVKP